MIISQGWVDKLIFLGYTVFSAFESFFVIKRVRAGSSPGRAPHLHCGGSGFKSCPVHTSNRPEYSGLAQCEH